MGKALDRLEVKLASIRVAPYVRVVDGKPIFVKGYTRKFHRAKTGSYVPHQRQDSRDLDYKVLLPESLVKFIAKQPLEVEFKSLADAYVSKHPYMFPRDGLSEDYYAASTDWATMPVKIVVQGHERFFQEPQFRDKLTATVLHEIGHAIQRFRNDALPVEAHPSRWPEYLQHPTSKDEYHIAYGTAREVAQMEHNAWETAAGLAKRLGITVTPQMKEWATKAYETYDYRQRFAKKAGWI